MVTKDNIRAAIKKFIEKDKDKLLRVDIYEPTISHRIAVYLEETCTGFDVDCEYNKNLLGDKKTSNGKKIRPDIIIHSRVTDSNSVIIEVKKSGTNSKLAKEDIKKLRDCMFGTLNYRLGVFVGILKKRVDVCWIEKENNLISETVEIFTSGDQ